MTAFALPPLSHITSLRTSVVFRDVMLTEMRFFTAQICHTLFYLYVIQLCIGCWQTCIWRKGKKKPNLKLTVHFESNTKEACQSEFFYRRWGMLSVAIDKFNRESTLQREVKLDTGEFDPLPATLRHFLLNLAAVRDDGLRAKEQNKRWGEMLEDGRMSEDMRPLWWEITEFIMVTDVNGFPTFSFFFPLDASSYPDETRWQWENKW